MSKYEEIRNLLKTSRSLLGGEKMVQESREIKKRHGLILEQEVSDDETIDTPDNIFYRDEPKKSIEINLEYETAVEGDDEEGEEKAD